MGTKNKHGFTIIEVMLFLAVAGTLTMAILVGSGIAISQQRYRDSVNSLKSFIQLQYSDTINVANDRLGEEACTSEVKVVAPPSAAAQPRGTSDCVILGKYITINGEDMTTADVLGLRQSGSEVRDTDLAELRDNYTLGLAAGSETSSQVEWGARIVTPKTFNEQAVSLLIIRSPLSGAVMTFVHKGIEDNLAVIVNEGIVKEDKDLCVDAEAGTFVGNRQAVRIGAYASSQSAIEIPSESDSVCDA